MFYAKKIYTGAVMLFACLMIFVSCSHVQTSAHADSNGNYFQLLQKRLISDGFDEKSIKQLYRRQEVKFETKRVSSYFVHTESKLNYGQFLKQAPIERARAYMREHRAKLADAEKKYGVDKRVITAILLVETRFGGYTGKSSVFNVLSTMAALSDPQVKDMLWGKISGSTQLSRQEFEAKAGKKSGWAYDELKAFLTYTSKEKMNPMNIHGSYAGAMGLCQFMPSNILTLARDGNKDGRIDLFDHADAIMSIASYLSHYGWYPGIDSQGAYNVVYHYNHSEYYVNTILKIVEILKG